MVDYELNNAVNAALHSDEKLLWYDKPDPKRVMLQLDSIIMVVFSIPWTAFAVFWVCAACGFKIPDFSGPTLLLIFPLFGVPFILIGLWMMTTPYRKYLTAKKTVYIITDQRCMIMVNSPKAKKIDMVRPENIGNFKLVERANGAGDLTFAQEQYTSSKGQSRLNPIGFWGIPEVRKVERIMEDAFKSSKNVIPANPEA